MQGQQIETQYNAGRDININQYPPSPTAEQQKQNRAEMLERVQKTWIDGVLEPSLLGAAQITLQLQNKPNAVVNSLQQVREFDRTGPLSPADASIVQIYDNANKGVLILGEPGAGKTTLLLELTRVLLQRARQNEKQPIPVVFPLSSWATRREPLTQWLAFELHDKYQIPFPLAMDWIKKDQVLPLLDGLDEVAAPQRVNCVEAINTYYQSHGLLGTVVCSRQSDYLALSTRLLLRTAVVVEPLTLEQIESYLMSGGERLKALHQALREDADLRALASTPLMLNVLTTAYQGTAPQKIFTTGDLGIKQEQVFFSYVQRMLPRRNPSKRYTLEQIIHWLSYLSRQMKRQNQPIFYIEHMQLDWVSGTWMFRAYYWLTLLLPGILVGVLVSLLFFSWPRINDPPSVMSILLCGLLGGLLSGGNAPNRHSTNTGKDKSIRWQQFLQWLLIGIFIGLGVGLTYGRSEGLRFGLSYGLIVGLSYGLSFGLCIILLQIFIKKSDAVKSPTQVLPPVRRTKWKRLIRSTGLRNGLLVGLLIWLSFELQGGLIYGLGGDMSEVLSYGLTEGLDSGLNFGLFFGLLGGLLSLLLSGRGITIHLTDSIIWSWKSLGRSLRLSQHVRAALLVAALVGLIAGLFSGLDEGLWNHKLIFRLSDGLLAGLIAGLIVGLGYWLLFGLFQAVSSVTIEDQQRVIPNQGIRHSALNGLLLGLTCAMISGLIVGLVSGRLSNELIVGLISGLWFGLIIGLLVGFLNGGWTCLQHYVLRTLLWRSGAIPWNYAHFLDFTAERILLRKVGGGYIFLHRLLLDYFANLATEPKSDESSESRQERFATDTTPSATIGPIRANEHLDVPTSPLTPTPILSEVPRLLPCGHEQHTPNARFCSACGKPVPSSSLE
jgi:energy-coupling factor transporter ATP-binding protein EcfA2